MPTLQDYAKQLQQAQAAYGAAKTAEEKAKAAALGQQIRQAAQKAGYSTSQLESAAQQVWKSSSPSAGSSTSSSSKSSGAVTYSGSKPAEGGGFYVTDASGKQIYVPPLTKETAEQVISGLSPQAQAQARQVASQVYPQWFGTAAQQQVQPQVQGLTPEQVQAMLREALSEYSFPYEQLLRDYLAAAPRYTPPSEEELARQARQWAELQINPQIAALQRALETALQAYEAQRQQIEASYASAGEMTRRLLEEARARALEEAIARGGGRSGQVEWYMQKLQAPVLEELATQQAQRAAALSDIAAKMALAQTQAQEQIQELTRQLGELEASRLAELRNLAHATAAGDWERAWQAATNLASMAAAGQQATWERIMAVLPLYTMTAAERAAYTGQVPLETAEVAQTGYVPLRTYATAKGAKVDYDPSTGDVIINGIRYPANVLQSMFKAVQRGGSWWIPQNVLDALLGRAA